MLEGQAEYPLAWSGVKPDDNDRIALYVRLSRVFRQLITSGAWTRGSRLPTIAELSKEYQVGAVTVRQALAFLAADGLIVSTRGRGTYVTEASNREKRDTGDTAPDAIAKPKIKIIRRVRNVTLPDNLAAGETDGSFTRIDKVHISDGIPFVLMEIFVASSAYDRFPKSSDKAHKISALFREHSKIPVTRDRQVFMISYADRITSKHLQCSLGTVLIQMRSWWYDRSDKIVFAGNFLYRGDMFVLERGGSYPTGGLLPTARK
ncbi:MAG: GntR family transcriptional regulator [Xanthobacteraceae bacterium]